MSTTPVVLAHPVILGTFFPLVSSPFLPGGYSMGFIQSGGGQNLDQTRCKIWVQCGQSLITCDENTSKGVDKNPKPPRQGCCDSATLHNSTKHRTASSGCASLPLQVALGKHSGTGHQPPSRKKKESKERGDKSFTLADLAGTLKGPIGKIPQSPLF